MDLAIGSSSNSLTTGQSKDTQFEELEPLSLKQLEEIWPRLPQIAQEALIRQQKGILPVVTDEELAVKIDQFLKNDQYKQSSGTSSSVDEAGGSK